MSCNQICAVLVQHVRASEQAQESTSPSKIDVTIKSPVGDISVVTLIRTDTTLDHSQKAEKVCVIAGFKPKIIKIENVIANTISIMCAKEISTGHVGDATELTAYNLSAGCVCSCSQANYLLRNSAMRDSIGSS